MEKSADTSICHVMFEAPYLGFGNKHRLTTMCINIIGAIPVIGGLPVGFLRYHHGFQYVENPDYLKKGSYINEKLIYEETDDVQAKEGRAFLEIIGLGIFPLIGDLFYEMLHSDLAKTIGQQHTFGWGTDGEQDKTLSTFVLKMVAAIPVVGGIPIGMMRCYQGNTLDKKMRGVAEIVGLGAPLVLLDFVDEGLVKSKICILLAKL